MGKADSSENTSVAPTRAQSRDRVPVRWGRRILAGAGAIVTIGGAIAVISQSTHMLSGLSHNSPPISEIARSPVLGISFYQNGHLDPMSYSSSNQTAQEVVNASVQPEPFELWFPALGAKSSLNICISASRSIFTTATRNPTSSASCLYVFNSAADYGYASGALYETSSRYIVHTAIGGNRAQPASGGDQQYYVSHLISFPKGFLSSAGKSLNPHLDFLTNEHRKLYLVAYLNTNDYHQFQPGNVEDFTLTFG
jgi:hypothetical protein